MTTMTTKKPKSYLIFLSVATTNIVAFLIASLFAWFHVDKKYAIFIAFIMTIAFAFSTVGIYEAIKFKTDDQKQKFQNKVGLVGNIIVLLYVLTIIIYAVYTTPSNGH